MLIPVVIFVACHTTLSPCLLSSKGRNVQKRTTIFIEVLLTHAKKLKLLNIDLPAQTAYSEVLVCLATANKEIGGC